MEYVLPGKMVNNRENGSFGSIVGCRYEIMIIKNKMEEQRARGEAIYVSASLYIGSADDGAVASFSISFASLPFRVKCSNKIAILFLRRFFRRSASSSRSVMKIIIISGYRHGPRRR